MGMTATSRRFSAIAAIFAVLLAALAPAITSALAAANDQHVVWTAVCTADGARLVAVPTDADGVPVAPKSRHVDHCPFCSSGATPAVLAPAAVPEIPVLASGDPITSPSPRAPCPPLAWASAQPRAPPAVS